jgi:aryl-alcohol dehydrogenase-like predicted oxidoreductase
VEAARHASASSGQRGRRSPAGASFSPDSRRAADEEEMAVIRKRVLGKTGVEVSEIGLGTMELRGPRIWDGRPVSDREAERLLHTALDLGINFLDTSPDYGLSETYIGRFLASRREEYFLATKCGCCLVDRGAYDETTHVWTRRNILDNVHRSLERLRTDHVDLLQLHNAGIREVRDNAILDVLQEAKDSGKTRFIGVSSTWPDLADFIAMPSLDTIQTTYSALDLTHRDLISAAARRGLGVIVRGAVVKGALTDLESRNLVENLRKTVGKRDLWRSSRLEDVLGSMPPMEFLIRFALSHAGIHTVLLGTLHPDHLKEDVTAAHQGPLPDALCHEVEAYLAASGIGPVQREEGGLAR